MALCGADKQQLFSSGCVLEKLSEGRKRAFDVKREKQQLSAGAYPVILDLGSSRLISSVSTQSTCWEAPSTQSPLLSWDSASGSLCSWKTGRIGEQWEGRDVSNSTVVNTWLHPGLKKTVSLRRHASCPRKTDFFLSKNEVISQTKLNWIILKLVLIAK